VITVSELVTHLDWHTPFAWAEEWDRVGLLAGSGDWPVARVFVSLDASLSSLERARAAGATVLLTHHPAFLEPLTSVTPGTTGGGVAFEAVRSGVALVNCHTNLDRAPEGADALPSLLGLEMTGPLEPVSDDPARPRMGRICVAPANMTLKMLAALVGQRLGVRPRVWGAPDTLLSRIAVAPGSGRSLLPAAAACGCDAVLTGELRYHDAHAALEAGLFVIEAGHDATEWPLTRALAGIAEMMPGLVNGSVIVDDVAGPSWIA
jgi:dinuclear metal center YbgI/SA1388 family protein